jgi:hypothetical protein
MNMAFLGRHEQREAWIRWGVEFARRGVLPEDPIEVHGPHGYPADRMWGTMGDYEFLTPRGIRGIWDIRGVRVTVDGMYGIKETLPVLPAQELEPKLKRWLRAAKSVLAKMDRDRMAERKEINKARQAAGLEAGPAGENI